MDKPLDKIDYTILRSLCKDGRTIYRDIAKQLNVSPQTISDRVKKLEEDKKVIRNFTIDIDPEKIGYDIEFICELDIDASHMDHILSILDKILEIHVIKITTGIHDILCIGNAVSIENLHDIVEKQISLIEGVNKTYTSITLRKVKQNQVLNFDI
ncbi:MAG: Lrp/AsnC family transcriptional regulator [Candidatus Hodarchaeales archaeon]|jgi:Lrp/AsnC family transcriptional regulator for asnA, asnC and gidA